MALPATVIAAPALGLPGGAVVGDISFGSAPLSAPAPYLALFSTAPGSTGHPGAAPVSPGHPNINLELGAGDGAAAADIYSSYNITGSGGPFGAFAPGPFPAPCGPIDTNIQTADENGLPPLALGPNVGLGLAPGDNLNKLAVADHTAVDFVPPGGDGMPDAPVFFTVDPATAAGLPAALPPFFGAFGPTGAADVLAWDPVTSVLYDWAPAAMLGLAPGDDVSALEVSLTSGAPVSVGWIGPPDEIAFSLAPASPTNGPLGSLCYGPGSGTPGDVYDATVPMVFAAPFIDAEMLGLDTTRSGGTADDTVDAIDFVLASGVDLDGDLIDDAADFDKDGDLVGNLIDNCPTVPNPAQANSDSGPPPPAGNTGMIDNGPGIAANDTTVPNGDGLGDACDPDLDNDGLPNVFDTEPLAAGAGPCAAFAGASDGHPSPAGGDNTNDDNGNGIPAPPMGADLADNGPSWDTDSDGVLDGVECALGANPRSAASKPTAAMCGGAADIDLDGLPASAEKCKWGTVDGLTDTDGDGKKDCVEANDTNGDGVQNFPGDTINSAKAANGVIGKTLDFDLDGNGFVTFPGDTILSAKMVNHVGGICM